jgi:hypothetical protein
MAEVDGVRAVLHSEYMRRLRAMIPADLLHEDAPPFTRQVSTSSMNLAAMSAARQGYDAGRWGALADCPYPSATDGRTTFLRRSWLLGYATGSKVTPRSEPQPLDQRPVVIR